MDRFSCLAKMQLRRGFLIFRQTAFTFAVGCSIRHPLFNAFHPEQSVHLITIIVVGSFCSRRRYPKTLRVGGIIHKRYL